MPAPEIKTDLMMASSARERRRERRDRTRCSPRKARPPAHAANLPPPREPARFLSTATSSEGGETAPPRGTKDALAAPTLPCFTRRITEGDHSMKAIMYLGVLAMLVGCDGSKVELESTKSDLANITKERDDLKVQISTLQQQLAVAKSDLAKEKTTEAQTTDKSGKAPVASKSSATDSATPTKGKGASKPTHKS